MTKSITAIILTEAVNNYLATAVNAEARALAEIKSGDLDHADRLYAKALVEYDRALSSRAALSMLPSMRGGRGNGKLASEGKIASSRRRAANARMSVYS